MSNKRNNKSSANSSKSAKKFFRDKNRGTKGSKGRKPSFQKEELVGTVSMTREGYAFIEIPGQDNDIFVTASRLRGALNGDKVKVITTKAKGVNRDGKPKRIEGEVLVILERSKRPHIGILQVTRGEAWVIMESRAMPYDIRLPYEELDQWFAPGKPFGHLSQQEGAQADGRPWDPRKISGTKVAALVVDWPRRAAAPIGKLVDVLGEPGANDTEMHAILTEFGLPYRFEPEVENAADAISEVITPQEIAARRDFRKITTFTIDPTDAKDFDDALSFQRLPNGNVEIGVHIADVTYYVKPGSLVDKTAYERGTSVYLVDRTVPMLPEKLSNKLCSLRPNEEKLCFSAVFELDEKAVIVDKWFGRTIINSDYRFDYEEAQKVIETGEGALAAEIAEIHKLATLLRQKRFKSGAISFERPEMKVQVDSEGKPVGVYQKISKEANWLIEEFMLLANRSVAEYVGKVKRDQKARTFVYRIHEDPNEDKIGALRKFVRLFGYSLGGEDPNAAGDKGNKNNRHAASREANGLSTSGKGLAGAINGLLGDVKGKPEEGAIEIMALRAMARARYSTDNYGHYGLAFDYYTHFTSPIRRYPDMMVHRLLSMYLDGASSQDKEKYEEMCDYASGREQIATEAERASIKYKLVEFMQDKIGNIYEGSVSGLTEWGMYVEIEPTKVEGMVPLREIHSDYYVFDEETYTLTGKGTGKRYTLGDKVHVKVLRASLEQKIIDYQLIPEDSPELTQGQPA